MQIVVEIPVNHPEHPEYGEGGIIKTQILDDCTAYWRVDEVLPAENNHNRYRVSAFDADNKNNLD